MFLWDFERLNYLYCFINRLTNMSFDTKNCVFKIKVKQYDKIDLEHFRSIR